MDGAQEWDTRVLLAVPTSNAAASRRQTAKNPIDRFLGVPFLLWLAQAFAVTARDRCEYR